jgi:hypothetical protein
LKCPTGFYGEKCKDKCNEGCILEQHNCDINTGKCDCKDNFWGNNCETLCSSRCKNVTGRKCDIKTGYCKKCQDRFIGIDCNQCNIGLWGNECEKNCSSGCDFTNTSCDKDNGNCKCKIGFFGTICDKSCDGCLNGCLDDGICKDFICKQGDFYNITCQKCSDKCVNHKCDRYSGECSECFDKKFGKECDIVCPEDCQTTECCSKDTDYNSIDFDSKDDAFIFCFVDSKCFETVLDFKNKSILVIPKKDIKLNGEVQDIEYYKSTSSKQVGADLEKVEYASIVFTGYRYSDKIKHLDKEIDIEFLLAEEAESKELKVAVPIVGFNKESDLIVKLFSKKFIEKDVIVFSRGGRLTVGDYPVSIKKNLAKLTFFDYDTEADKVVVLKSGISLSTIKEGYDHKIKITLNRKNNSIFNFSKELLSFFENKYFGPDSSCIQNIEAQYVYICPDKVDISKFPELRIIISGEVYSFKSSQFFTKKHQSNAFTPTFAEESSLSFGKDLFNEYDLVFADRTVSIYNENIIGFKSELLPLPASFDESSYGGIIALLVILVILIILLAGYLLYKKYRFQNHELRAPLVES